MDLDETWQRVGKWEKGNTKIFGEIAPEAPEKGARC